MSFLDEQPTQVGNQQDNSGALYPNLSRKKESHPNCRGRSLIKGTWFWVSGWNNIMPSGTSRYISLSYTEMTLEDVAKYITNKDTQPKTTTSTQTQTLATKVEEPVKNNEVVKEAMAETASKDEIF